MIWPTITITNYGFTISKMGISTHSVLTYQKVGQFANRFYILSKVSQIVGNYGSKYPYVVHGYY